MFSDEAKKGMKKSVRIKILIIFLTILFVVMMFPKGESLDSEVTVGSVWIKEDLIASTTFEILKDPEVYQAEMRAASAKVHRIFLHQQDIPELMADSIESYSAFLKRTIDADISNSGSNYIGQTFLSPGSYQVFLNIRKMENSLSSEYDVTLTDIVRVSRNFLSSAYRRGVMDLPYDEIEDDTITVREGKFEKLVEKTRYFDPAGVAGYVDEYIRKYLKAENDVIEAVNEYIQNFLVANIQYSEALTEEAREIARNNVSRNVGIVNEDERIVAKHNRISPEIKLKIDSYRAAIGEEKGFLGQFTQNVGKFFHVVLVLTIFSLYIYLFRKRIYRDNQKIMLIAIIILIVAFNTFLVQQINVSTPVHLLILVPVASMLLTIVFDSRVGFYGTVAVALIAGGLRGNDYVFSVMNILSGALAAYTVRDIKNRNQIFRSFLYILLGYVTGIVAFGLERYASAESMLIDSAFAASNALISPVLTYGLIIFFEKAFGITTELTLLELTDFNHPLLKEMQKNAPGTFSHSMTIGSLVENAAEEIGGNALLARVGAYYHDIGKSLNPANFVENQMSRGNVHEEMDPRESCKVIIDHVNEGIRLAREKNLPEEIVNFIPMHHGTMVVYFFFKKAKELFGEENVDIEDFRYPGPKPDSKETALVMLADACESAVRAMEEPDPDKIKNVVNNLIQIRIDDGQLDNAPITFRDIKKIKEAFYNVLISQHHKRIRYPKQDELEKEKKQEN